MYIVICFDSIFDNGKIIGFIYFSKIKHIIHYTKGVIKYADLKQKRNDRKYRTYKNFFKIIKVKNDDVIKYFCGNFYKLV